MAKANSTAACKSIQQAKPDTDAHADLRRLEIDLNDIAEKLDAIHETLRAGYEAGEGAGKMCLVAADVVLAQNNALSAALERLDEMQIAARAGEAPATDTPASSGALHGELTSVDEQLFHARKVIEAIEQDADDPVGLAGAALKFLEEASDTVGRLDSKAPAADEAESRTSLDAAWAQSFAERIDSTYTLVSHAYGTLKAIQDGLDPHTSVSSLCCKALFEAMESMERMVDELKAASAGAAEVQQ